mmetsp:Transcript_21518/g.32022  ORF Transcript_21518/g.32022 Transcript_21518/m.32022 type:complete len:506 (+) Transcript_21518:139-1656(+)|eukprot:CAMPEP_0167761938 /NCGR_PEP_ID=MMETSP0110_2-20121227/12462_1 /TAXON_ID=629695 /ORGANISM="Gymnochlora sp., Strain CCMP2014" /LENGTH=505 /DNA_ID=CAMNT_0007648701 /DNA_START=71 /DNA_END=1588 /DNA_ORIENTATION=-
MSKIGQHQKKCIGPWTLGRALGFGTTSRVHYAVHSVTKTTAAVKIIRKRSNLDLRKLQREISILRLLNHRFITRLYDVFESKNHIYMVMELVDGGELFDHIIQNKRFQRHDALRVFRQVAEATKYFHSHGIVHRDIKPENILVHSTGDIKIADFGFATARKSGILKTSCGSPHYACPEICSSSPYDGTKADSWSLGVLLFVLVTGDFPFNDQNYGALFHKIQTGKYVIPSHVDQDVADLITKLLTVDPEQRLTVDGILAHKCMKPVGKAKQPIVLLNGLNEEKKEKVTSSVQSPSVMEESRSGSVCSRSISSEMTQQRRKSRISAPKCGAPMNEPARITEPLDERVLTELVYLGWADNSKDLAQQLDSKHPSLCPSVRTAYRALKQKISLNDVNSPQSTVTAAPSSSSQSSPKNEAKTKFPPPALSQPKESIKDSRSWSSRSDVTRKRAWNGSRLKMDVCTGGPTAAAAVAVDSGTTTMLRGGSRGDGIDLRDASSQTPSGCWVM